MDAGCLAHALTDAERERFEADGYLLLQSVLDPSTVADLAALADREYAAAASGGPPGPLGILNLHDLVGRDDRYLELVDWPATFPKVWGILGWNVQLFHTQLIVTPPVDVDVPAGGYGWHQDNNRMNVDFETPPPHPRVSVKLGYLLSDVPEPGMGNFCVVPGSHLLGRPRFRPGEQPDGARELCGAAGDAVLFDRRLWHSASGNRSTATRRMLFYGYSHRWLRPKSRMDLAALAERCDPVRRQLLGHATSANGYFDPEDDDVPLRTWIREHLGDGAVAA